MMQTSLQAKLIESTPDKPGMTEPLNLTIPKVIAAILHRLLFMEHMHPITRHGTFNKYRLHALDGRRCPRQQLTTGIKAMIQIYARQPIPDHHPKTITGAGFLHGIPASPGVRVGGRCIPAINHDRTLLHGTRPTIRCQCFQLLDSLTASAISLLLTCRAAKLRSATTRAQRLERRFTPLATKDHNLNPSIKVLRLRQKTCGFVTNRSARSTRPFKVRNFRTCKTISNTRQTAAKRPNKPQKQA